MAYDPNFPFEEKNPPLVQFIMDLGFARTAKQANIVLLIIGIVFISVSIFLFAKAFGGPSDSDATYEDELFLEDPLLYENY